MGYARRGLCGEAGWRDSAGSLPGTNTTRYRTSDGLIWVALFNSHPDTSEDEFFVDLITEMGKAAFLDEFINFSGAVLICAIAVGVFICTKIKRRRSKLKENQNEGDAI